MQSDFWIVKHPAKISSRIGVEVLSKRPDMNDALNEASKLEQILSERLGGSRSNIHMMYKDYFSVVEMESGKSVEDVITALVEGKNIKKIVSLANLKR